MPTTTVEILQMPCSYSSGEYPLLSSATQSLSGYVKATYTDFKIRDDLRQQIRVPAFGGWSDCNMVRADGRLYWILDATTASGSEHSVDMVISYCGPSSVLHKGDQIAGCFERLPTNKCPYLHHTPITSDLQHTRTVDLPNLGVDMDGNKVFWCQVTAQVTVDDAVDTRRYGMFVAFGPNGETDIHLPYVSSLQSDLCYPSLYDVISDPDGTFGVTASAILDVSISERCPYKPAITIGIADQHFEIYAIRDNVETAFPPNKGLGDSLAKQKWYWIEESYKEISESIQWSGPVDWVGSASITLSDLERGCGTITIRDEDTSSVGTIPASYGATLEMSIRTISDYTGLYTYCTYGGYQVCLQEGKIPWNGTAWEEYRAYSMAYDRQAMEQSIDYSNQRVAVNLAQGAASTIQSAAMGFIGGDMTGGKAGVAGGAASYAISAWATMRESQIAESESRATQALAERRARGQPSTPYNTGYGLIYCERTTLTPASIWVEMPAGLTASIDADYTACFGYPAEGLRSITIQEGYIKGRIYDNGLARGPRFDRCNETLQNGILFKEV